MNWKHLGWALLAATIAMTGLAAIGATFISTLLIVDYFSPFDPSWTPLIAMVSLGFFSLVVAFYMKEK